MKNILGFILGIIVCLIIVEAYVSNSFVMDKYINDYDPEVGRIRRANTEYVKFNEGFGIGKVNNLSYLNKEFAIEKSENTIRIALMGDSYVESFQVFDRNYFGRIMENILSEKLNQTVEVMNFGRSGFDIGDCYVYYNTFVKKFNPDYVLYIFGADDFKTRSSEPLLPIISFQGTELTIERPYIDSKYLSKLKKSEPFLKYSTLVNSMNTGRKLLKKDYILPQLFDKLYKNNEIPAENNEINNIPQITFTPEIDLILDQLEEANGIFFIRSDIYILNDKYTFNNITQVFENKEYNPHDWKIAKTTGHWNNQAHRDIGLYMAEKMEKIIRNTHGLATNNTNKHE